MLAGPLSRNRHQSLEDAPSRATCPKKIIKEVGMDKRVGRRVEEEKDDDRLEEWFNLRMFEY